MGKLLKVMVVFLLLFSIGSLVLGVLLFNKRELLKGRTQKLERTIIQLGTTIESAAAEPRAAVYPARDLSECTAQELDAPERSDFWDKYKSQLEVQDAPRLDLNPKKIQLMQYYQIDPVTLQPTRDLATGLKMTSGPGTMQEVLDDLVNKSAAQLARLNETRQQLTDVREELVRTVTELNERKGTLRTRLKEIVDLKDQVAKLSTKIRQLEGEIEGLKQEKRALEAQVADLQGQVDNLTKEKEILEELVKQLKDDIRKLRTPTTQIGATPGIAQLEPTQVVRMEPGEKGSVVAVNTEWNFLVLKLTDECLAEVFNEQGILTPVDLYVRRPARNGEKEQFVTKVRLIQASRAQKIGVADILNDWQQMPARDGDVIFR